jgi:hypothetical protein
LDEENVPAAFLMDAKVSVVLNPEDKQTENTTVNLTLSRAAAKIVVVLTEGPGVAFQSPDNEHVYHFRNLPYSTAVLPGVSHAPSVRSTMPHQVNGYVDWSSDDKNGNSTISITGYVYAYDYKGEQLDKHTSLVINILVSEQIYFIAVERRDEIGIVFIQAQGVFDKFFSLFFCCHFNDF